MREHQIVITLKPEQFLQVQKLARNSGAKSMGLFVRQQLLAALGIEGNLESNNTQIEPIVSELKRMHAELREFVSESLSMYDNDYFEEDNYPGEPVSSDPDGFFMARNPEEISDSPDITQDSGGFLGDELETLAEQTFTSSPRLGKLETPEYKALDAEELKALRTLTGDEIKERITNYETSSSQNGKNLVESNSGFESRDPKDKSLRSDAVQMERDPLENLLDELDLAISGSSEGDSNKKEAEQESLDVPLSLAERKQQLARAQAEANRIYELKSTVAENQPIESVQIGDNPNQIVAKPEKKDDDNLFSGGPPPKKREE